MFYVFLQLSVHFAVSFGDFSLLTSCSFSIIPVFLPALVLPFNFLSSDLFYCLPLPNLIP